MAKELQTIERDYPVCPNCNYEMTIDDMLNVAADIFDISPREEQLPDPIICPSCMKEFWVRGGYDPHYTTAKTEEELEEI